MLGVAPLTRNQPIEKLRQDVELGKSLTACAPLAAGPNTVRDFFGGQRGVLSLLFGVREPCDAAGEIPPSPPLAKEGTEMPPFAKGAAQSAGGFSSIVTHKEHSPAASPCSRFS